MVKESLGMQPNATPRLEGGGRNRKELHPERPLVSIVIVVFQAKEGCSSLLNSICRFDDPELEIIVIDGGSKDGTVEVLRQWDKSIDYWLSEPDHGIYDAMNKGISAAQGEYILHLNEGDSLRFIPHQKLGMCLAEGVDIASFSVLTDTGEIFRPQTGFLLRLTNTWHHQGTFYRRTRHPGYDIRYRVFGDLDLNQRMLKSGKVIRLFDDVVSYHQDDGVSRSRAAIPEIYQIVRRNFGMPYVVLAFLWFKYKGIRQRGHWLAAYLASRAGSP